MKHRSEPDYIDRTIATVRNHRDADNCWPQWANIFADEIEDLRADVGELKTALGMIAQRTYPASYIGMDTDGNRIYGHVEDAARFAQSELDKVKA